METDKPNKELFELCETVEAILRMYFKKTGIDLPPTVEQAFKDIKKQQLERQGNNTDTSCHVLNEQLEIQSLNDTKIENIGTKVGEMFDVHNINEQSKIRSLNIRYKDTKIENIGTKVGEMFDVLKGTNIGQDIGKIFDEITKDITIDLTPSKKDFFQISGGFNFFDFFKNQKF